MKADATDETNISHDKIFSFDFVGTILFLSASGERPLLTLCSLRLDNVFVLLSFQLPKLVVESSVPWEEGLILMK